MDEQLTQRRREATAAAAAAAALESPAGSPAASPAASPASSPESSPSRRRTASIEGSVRPAAPALAKATIREEESWREETATASSLDSSGGGSTDSIDDDALRAATAQRLGDCDRLSELPPYWTTVPPGGMRTGKGSLACTML